LCGFRFGLKGTHYTPLPMSRPALVWNKGIAALCDWRVPDEFPSGEYRLHPKCASDHLRRDLIDPRESPLPVETGDIVWVRLSCLGSFIEQALPHIGADFVLATGDSDWAVPSAIASLAPAILEHPRVIAWFAQNALTATDGRLSPLPIGIDFHTVSEGRAWGEEVTSPIDQERAILAIAESLPPVERRVPRVYLDFASSASYGDRAAILAAMRGNPLAVVQPARLPRNVMFRVRGEFAFVASPHGNGLDCHRTWEALALGHIVLVPTSPLDPLYDGLAVVPIHDWRSIGERDLAEWLGRYAPLTRENPRLTSRWWAARMRAATPAARESAPKDSVAAKGLGSELSS